MELEPTNNEARTYPILPDTDDEPATQRFAVFLGEGEQCKSTHYRSTYYSLRSLWAREEQPLTHNYLHDDDDEPPYLVEDNGMVACGGSMMSVEEARRVSGDRRYGPR